MFQKSITKPSTSGQVVYEAIISANELTGPFTTTFYQNFNDGDYSVFRSVKAKSLKGAEKQANDWLATR